MVRNECKSGRTADDLNDNKFWGGLLNKALPNGIDYRNVKCYGIIKNDQPMVAWSYYSFLEHQDSNRRLIEASVSIAAFHKQWHPFTTIRLILSFFFQEKRYNRLTAVTFPSNRQAVRLVNLAGFTLEGIIRRPAGFENYMQFSLLREDWENGRFYG